MRHKKLTPRKDVSKSPKGRDTQVAILEAALEIFIQHSYKDFSIQRVAEACGLSRGNVSYYYPTRNELLHELLQSVLHSYTEEFDAVVDDPALSAEDKFLTIIEMIMTDLATNETTYFFPELWALANHDEQARSEMEELYKSARAHLTELLKELNPALSKKERELVGLFISASMEGHTPFVGEGKEFEKELPTIIKIASYSFLHTAKTITKRDLARIAPVITAAE